MSKTHSLAQLRIIARQVLLKDGTALAPTMETPETIDDTFCTLAEALTPTLEREQAALLGEVADRDLARRLSDHGGAIMSAYGTAGYFVGLAMGLELAALTVGEQVQTTTHLPQRVEGKDGKRYSSTVAKAKTQVATTGRRVRKVGGR